MRRISKDAVIKYSVTVGVGLLIAFIYCLIKGLFNSEETVDRLRIICDAVTIPGVLMLCFGLLTFVVKEGFFDGLGYSFKSMRRVRRNYRDDNADTPKTYYDYKESVKTKRKVAWHLVIVGLCFIAAAILLAVMHG